MVPGEQRRFWFPVALAPKNPATGVQEAVIFDIDRMTGDYFEAMGWDVKSGGALAETEALA